MSEKSNTTGHCLCGAIKFTAKLISHHADACHCSMCRRWSGGPFIGAECAAGDLQISGGDQLTIYPSSDWAERAFCSQCGSHLFYRLKPTGQFAIPVGLLDDRSRSGLRFSKEIFIDEKPVLYEFANSTKKMTGAEVMATFAASQKE